MTRAELTNAIVDWLATPADHRNPPHLRGQADRPGSKP
jgi:hypothetical protein